MMFLDPQKPLATCRTDACDHCTLNHQLNCHFSLKEWIHFLLISLPPFLLGGAGIYAVNGWMLIVWIILLVAFFGFIEIRVMCSHCPHYAEPASSLKCWANYGSPKLWKYRPGPMTLAEKTIFFGGFALVWGAPLAFLIFGAQFFLLAVYAMTTAGFFATLLNFMCPHCMNFACPLNRVGEETRRQFFHQNPSVAKAWGKAPNGGSDSPATIKGS